MGALPVPRSARLLSWWAFAFCGLTVLVAAFNAVTGDPAGKALPSAVAGLASSPGLFAAAAWYVVAYVALHIAPAVAWAWLLQPFRIEDRALVLSFLPLPFALLLANASLFPASAFTADLTDGGRRVAAATAMILCVYAAAGVAAGIVARIRAARRPARAAAVAVGVVLALAFVAVWPGRAPAPAVRAHPDVLVIGIDGLRPDHVVPALTPALHALLDGGVRIESAWTPLARTFPAWVSLLTGRYPAATGAHFNLIDRAGVDDAGSLAHRFGALGYQRVYAIDETRFSNIDTSFGFDRQVGPAVGGFDFLLSVAGDLPMVNLVAGTRAGRALFPHAHLNRALAFAYRPERFDAALARAVRCADPARPLFLVAHFELPHWPYRWAGDRAFRFAPQAVLPAPVDYQRSVARADAQVGDLMRVLADAGRLDDAVLVVASDHGESFRGREPPWHGDGGRDPLAVHAGHGTHVMSAAQYRVVLGFRGYGTHALPHAATVRTTASLVDVRPTLEAWLSLPAAGPAPDGRSLWSALNGAPDAVDPVVLLETGFTPPSVAAGAPDVAVLVAESARHYRVDRAGRLSLRAESLDELLHAKQRAAVSGDWILAALPAGRDAPATLLLGDLATRTYWDVARDALPPHAPVAALREALHRDDD